jgi:cytochrome oxidase Cu insertion factor (SCO1/SenC/PrrC family)
MVMPGDRSVQLNDPTIVGLFYHAIHVQFGWVVLLAVAVAVVVVLLRARSRTAGAAEAVSRTYLRWSFGIFWLIDGVLQHQGAMPLGLANQVVAPAADGAPSWLHTIVFEGVGLWNRYPIALAAATMWIQIGIGLLLLSTRGVWSRYAAGFSVLWAMVIWVAGNAMGGIFSTSSSILFGWPGAITFYVAAGVWLALDPRNFPERFSRVTLRALGALLGIGALVQAWPDHGFWSGGAANPLRQMTLAMTSAAQPQWLGSLVRSGGRVGSLMGGGLNLVVIFWLALCAAGLWGSATRAWRWPLRVLAVGCVLIWVIAQDAAFFGGLSTDVNSMFPLLALAWCASPAWRTTSAAIPDRLPITRIPELSRRTFATMGASVGLAMVLVAVVPMARCALSAGAETTTFLAQNAEVSLVKVPAPPFTLTDQHGASFSLPTHNSKYTVLTFLDPKCWTDCPLLSHQLEDLDRMLTPAERRHVQLVAVAANIFHEQVPDLRAFIAKNYLGSLGNFVYVTGPLATMRQTWADYGVTVTQTRRDRMSIHSDLMDVIDPSGQIRVIVPDDPGAGWAGEQSAASELLASLHAAGLR